MPSHKIALTTRGFKILSNDIFVDILSLFIVLSLVLFGQNWNLEKAISFLIFFIVGIIFYFYYNYKFGYIYAIAFGYQILLYLLITPSAYLGFFNILITLLFTLPLFYKENPFQRLYFPLGLYMSLVNTAIWFLESKLKIVKFSLSNTGSEFQQLSSIFLSSELLDFGFFSEELYSPLENASFIAIIGLGILIFREYNFIIDLFNTVLCFFLVSSLYNFEIDFYITKILTLTLLWVFVVYAPGRYFGFSYLFTTLSLIVTAVVSYPIWKWMNISVGMVYVSIYFIVQSFFFWLTYQLKFKKYI